MSTNNEIPSIMDCVSQIKNNSNYELYCTRLKKLIANSNKIVYDRVKEEKLLSASLERFSKCDICSTYYICTTETKTYCFICSNEICLECIRYHASKYGVYDYSFCKNCIHPDFKLTF